MNFESLVMSGLELQKNLNDFVQQGEEVVEEILECRQRLRSDKEQKEKKARILYCDEARVELLALKTEDLKNKEKHK